MLEKAAKWASHYMVIWEVEEGFFNVAFFIKDSELMVTGIFIPSFFIDASWFKVKQHLTTYNAQLRDKFSFNLFLILIQVSFFYVKFTLYFKYCYILSTNNVERQRYLTRTWTQDLRNLKKFYKTSHVKMFLISLMPPGAKHIVDEQGHVKTNKDRKREGARQLDRPQ